MEHILAALRGKPDELLSYDAVRRSLGTIESATRKLEEIPLDKIVGSVNRYTDFSRSFLPRNASDVDRWARVRMGVEKLEGLPPIEAYKVGDAYFVLDGHHRVSVARELGTETIEGYVIPVYTRVPFSAGDQPDDLILKSEYDDFLAKTHLNDLRPDSNLLVTAPGQYQKLLEHISVHRYFMGEKRGADVPYDEAVTDWYDNVYLLVVEVIREQNLLRDFPGRTETDLYLWIMDHRLAISQGNLGFEVRPELAAADLAVRYSSTFKRRFPRLIQKARDLLTPGRLTSGPPPGVWRQEHQSPHRGNRLLDDILVTVPDWDVASGSEPKWPAVRLAIEVARREETRLTGLHVVTEERLKESPEVKAIQEAFLQRCAQAGVVGRLVVECGKAADLLIARSHWVDLIVFRLNYPPPSKPIQRLRSGARYLIRRSSALLLAVPDAPFRLDSALLAYGPGPKADEALYLAAYLAGRWGTRLTVVTVKKDSSSESLIGEARSYLETHGVQATYIEEDGGAARDAARAVLLNAEAHDADFLIMGGYESNPLLETLFSSTVDRVLRSTRRPVLICR